MGARRALVVVAGILGVVLVGVALVFLLARNASRPAVPLGVVTVTQTPNGTSQGPQETSASPTADAQASARESLAAARAASLQGLALDGRWVLQLSSKRDGIVDDQQMAANGTHTFSYADIKAQFDELSQLSRTAGMTPIVLTANDFGTKRSPDGDTLWVLLADPGGLGSKTAAQTACGGLFPQESGEALANRCVPRTLVPPP